MRTLGQTGGVRLLALIFGLMAASCATQKSAGLDKSSKAGGERQELAKTSTEPDATTKAKIQVAYGKLPLSFEANQGQTDTQVKYLSRGPGYTLLLTSTEAVLALRNPARRDTETRRRGDAEIASILRSPQSAMRNPQSMVLHMRLVGANPHSQVAGLDELPGKSNYFIGNDPQNWRTNIPTYAKVKYHDVYPGVDLVYYGNQRELEYDFVVAPGTDPKAIKLAFEGADQAEINPQGDLILRTAGGELHLHKPRIYQEINGVRHEVSGGYVLLGPETPARQDTETPLGTRRRRDAETRGHRDTGILTASPTRRVPASQMAPSPRPRVIGFEVAAYDASKPLVIDPVLSYSTYLGGNASDEGLDITVDSSGNAYVTGWTSSTNFPTTAGAL